MLDPIRALQAEGLEHPTLDDVRRLEKGTIGVAVRVGGVTFQPELLRSVPCDACTGKGYVVQVGPAGQSMDLPCRVCGGGGRMLADLEEETP